MAEQKEDNVADVIRIKAPPKTKPTVNDHFELSKGEKLGELKDNQILIAPEYISVDPYQRWRMGQWFGTPEKQMISFSVAKVLKSKNDKYKEGDYVYGSFRWSSKQIIDTDSITIIPPDISKYSAKDDKKYYKQELDDQDDDKYDVTEALKKIPRSYYCGQFGMPGATAYYGMIYRGGLKKNENVLISGAAGAVGSICGQIAKAIYGCHVVGIAGTTEKIKWITDDLGFDAGINYKEYGNDMDKVKAILKEKFPKGIDLFFDNVGGIFTEAVWDILNVNARVVICGQIASYNDDPDNPTLIRPFLGKLIYKQVDIRGFMVGEHLKAPKFYYDMARWITTGKIKIRETVIDGFEKTPDAFVGLFSGQNIGKMVVKCCD